MIAIEGNIGSGKTTLGRALSKKLSLPLYEELGNDYTEDLLSNFYEDKKRWSFTLQIHFLNERFRKIKEITHPESKGGILDRSIYGDQIFANVLHKDGFMTDAEHHTYSTLLENMLQHSPNPDLLIFLDCGVDVLYERIQNRGRDFESSIDKNYLLHLNDYYYDWISRYNRSNKIIINTMDYDFFVDNNLESILDKVSCYMK